MAGNVGKRAFESISKFMIEEFTVSYNYLSMSCVFRDMGLGNCADWCLSMSEENRQKGLEVFHHLEQRGLKFKLSQIPVTRQDWRAPLHILEEAYRQEQRLSGLVAVVYEAAMADKDYIMQHFIMNFFEKQLKSESTVQQLLSRLRRMQTSDLGVFKFDEELGLINSKK